MPQNIPVPDTAHAEIEVALNGQDYLFEYKYSNREERWYLAIYQNEQLLIDSLKVVENYAVTPACLDATLNGAILCLENKQTDDKATFDNVGIGKEYQLIYLGANEVLNV